MGEKIKFYTKKDYERAKNKHRGDWFSIATAIATWEQIRAGLPGYNQDQILGFRATITDAGLNPNRIKPRRGDGSD